VILLSIPPVCLLQIDREPMPLKLVKLVRHDN